MNLCIECRFYKAGKTEDEDTCAHNEAQRGGVRAITFYSCIAMRSGICGRDARLFEPPLADAA